MCSPLLIITVIPIVTQRVELLRSFQLIFSLPPLYVYTGILSFLAEAGLGLLGVLLKGPLCLMDYKEILGLSFHYLAHLPF
jgi:hypothetical protein